MEFGDKGFVMVAAAEARLDAARRDAEIADAERAAALRLFEQEERAKAEEAEARLDELRRAVATDEAVKEEARRLHMLEMAEAEMSLAASGRAADLASVAIAAAGAPLLSSLSETGPEVARSSLTPSAPAQHVAVIDAGASFDDEDDMLRLALMLSLEDSNASSPPTPLATSGVERSPLAAPASWPPDASLHSPPVPAPPTSPSSSGSVPIRTSQRKAALFTFLTEADLDHYGPVLIAEGFTGVDDLADATYEELIVIGFKNAEIKRLRRFLQSRAEAGGDSTGGSGVSGGVSSQGDVGIGWGSVDGVGGNFNHAVGGSNSGVSDDVKNSSPDAAQCDVGDASAVAGGSRADQGVVGTPCMSENETCPSAHRSEEKGEFPLSSYPTVSSKQSGGRSLVLPPSPAFAATRLSGPVEPSTPSSSHGGAEAANDGGFSQGVVPGSNKVPGAVALALALGAGAQNGSGAVSAQGGGTRGTGSRWARGEGAQSGGAGWAHGGGAQGGGAGWAHGGGAQGGGAGWAHGNGAQGGGAGGGGWAPSPRV